jgi:hypothetical protein
MMQTGRYLLKRCERCGEAYAVSRNVADRAMYCPECRKEAKREWHYGRLADFRNEARAKARERARFFAARDRAFKRAGLPKPTVTKASDGLRIERRGRCGGTAAGAIDTSSNRAMAFI